MTWNKVYKSMYQGSMVGSGAVVFAVWGYVIANMEPDSEVGAQVELNPKLLAAIIGTSEGDVEEALNYLERPDSASRTPDEDGRRLVRVGQFAYQVVNGRKYFEINSADAKRAGDRDRQARYRAKKKGRGGLVPGGSGTVRVTGPDVDSSGNGVPEEQAQSFPEVPLQASQPPDEAFQ